MNESKPRKNLVSIHLESISNTILWQYRVELGTVWRLMQGAHRFTRYNASATSTGMVGTHQFTGSSSRYDHLWKYGISTTNNPPPNVGIHAYLRNNHGYVWRQYSLAHFGTFQDTEFALATNNPGHLFHALDADLGRWRAEDTPFSVFFQADISHMAFDDEVKIRASTFSERFRAGYRQLDAAVNALLGLLIKHGLWENTLIAGYGDHGDELWSHTLTKGYCHAIAPYASLVWTPFFLYDNGLDAGDDDRLVSGVDFRDVVLGRLIPGFEPDAAMTVAPFSGFDVTKQPRDVAFSQNLYAMQVEYSDFEQALTKCYSATDGVFRLVVSSGGKRPRDGGLELFCDRTDPGSNRNLLDFFILDFNGDIASFRPPPEAVAADFTLSFTPEAVRGIVAAYHMLKEKLLEYVRGKEREAMPYSSSNRHVMPESAFKHALKRLRRDYDN